ncbi:hypothetical protein HZI73_04800 [Vallitalea pronyensis]|uniref:Carbohydrate esterase 2 N-terminal domain-containing protein n=1 Tax=Vallitalea pronyensis TaxID=1348613 RepID=A0A8J8MHQ1_9FIRM|nr:hypothetical protein [Vallitalea pronyensis]QUI21652.1 hypothetical protein HZI73_04800 [Vallitalea pronyensis]
MKVKAVMIVILLLCIGCTKVDKPIDEQKEEANDNKEKSAVEASINEDPRDEIVTKERTRIYPDNRNIKYKGRIDFENARQPILYWSGSVIQTHFEGTSLNLHFDDEGGKHGQNYYSVIIDGQETVLACEKGKQVYTVAEDLDDTVHSLKIVRRTEGWDGGTTFLGFDIDPGKRIQTPSDYAKLRIEFFGDGTVSGYGMDDAKGESKETKNKNYTQTFAAITAQNLEAEEHVTALSGLGIMKSDELDETMVDYYYRTDIHGMKVWDFKAWMPHMVIIHLGQNDYRMLQDRQPEEIKQAYVSFIHKISKKYNHNVDIVLTLGGTESMDSSSPFPQYIEEVVHMLREQEQVNTIHYMLFNDWVSTEQPKAAIHKKMAEQLTKFIKEHITHWDKKGEQLTYDLQRTQQDFYGFGAQVWAYGATDKYPDLPSIREKALEALNIQYIRIENYLESATWEDMKKLREVTNDKGIEWIYMIWYGPNHVAHNGMLKDPEGFGKWWAEHVEQLYQQGIEVEYIELMNEPDSNGEWSLGIAPKEYFQLVQHVRKELDEKGYEQVGIVGPGLTGIKHGRPEQYIEWFKDTKAEDLSIWSTHIWMDDQSGFLEGGRSIEKSWLPFEESVQEVNPHKPVFVTEYATKQSDYHNHYYKMPDNFGSWDDEKVFPYHSVSNVIPYAVRVYENTLALLNSGANSTLVWQLNDEPTEVHRKSKSWGLVDLWGNPKPVYQALLTLFPHIPVGAQVIEAPHQQAHQLYSGCFKDGNKIILGIANGNDKTYSTTVRLINAPAHLVVKDALAFEGTYYGSALTGEPDRGTIVNRTVGIENMGDGTYDIHVTLPRDSTLTVILDTE